MSRTIARTLWWVGAIALTVGVYVGLDRVALFDQLPELVQSALRIACGVVIVALAGTFDPWRPRGAQRE